MIKATSMRLVSPSHEELGAIQEQIIAVHEVFANFLEALVRVQEASVESKENTNSIAVQEQGPEVAVTEAKALVADSSLVLRPARLEDLRSAGFDLSPTCCFPPTVSRLRVQKANKT